MASNQELTNKLALDLGIDIKNRRPTAKEIFKWMDMDILPHSTTDTLLCEIYEWNGRNWRTTEMNLIGEIFTGNKIAELKKALSEVPRMKANVPDFEFTKENITDIGIGIPKLFNIGLKGNIDTAKDFSIKVNSVTKSRITNTDYPGIDILHKLSEFAQNNSKEYRRELKHNYISLALFYAESVEIDLKKDAETDLDIGFEVEGIDIGVKVDTETHKVYKVTYKEKDAPFAANFVKIKDL